MYLLTRIQKEQFKQPLYQACSTSFNHATYHGQLVALPHHLGVEKIPNTDFIGWSGRNNEPNRRNDEVNKGPTRVR